MSFEPRPTYEKYETETVIRSPEVRKDGLPDFVNERVREENGVRRENVSYTNSGPAIDAPPPLGVYVKGFGRVIGHALRAYRDIAVDVFQSMVILFLQHPSVGVFFLVAAGFTVAPILVFVGFGLISAVTVFVGALIVEGIALGVGIFVLFFAVPTAFITGLGAASTAVSAFFVVNAVAKFVRGRDIVDEFRTTDRSETEGRVYRQST